MPGGMGEDKAQASGPAACMTCGLGRDGTHTQVRTAKQWYTVHSGGKKHFLDTSCIHDVLYCAENQS